jgi:hypothetical protein
MYSDNEYSRSICFLLAPRYHTSQSDLDLQAGAYCCFRLGVVGIGTYACER